MNRLFSLKNIEKKRNHRSGKNKNNATSEYSLTITHLDIAPGETMVITGPSGSGKSTALDMLGMILQPDMADSFTLEIEGKEHDLALCWKKGKQNLLSTLRLKHMGYVLQTGGLLPFLSARANMELSARLNKYEDIRERVEKLAATLGISRILEAMPQKLSIGERQRVAIARALAPRPKIILADEPVAALDPYHARAVLDLLLQEVADIGSTLILVSHDPSVIKDFSLKELHLELFAEKNGLSRAVLGA